MRIMGLDVGDKTIGVAVSDLLGITAQGVTTVRRKSYKYDIDQLLDIIKEYNVNRIVVGLPKNMNNTIGPQGEKVMKFVEKFKGKCSLEMDYQDERLTTVAAHRAMISADMSRAKRKKVVDKVAATYILQTYLDKNKF
ncbi:Holliday junction resolvase RuvX [Abyssisolibacter fermentans]|uniref:Holliday junction resolvase RuvX n=1 Tax=Abyssisolibacter fermentans TaxID=1766203 RepID=UPI00082E4E1F|nr:Holliday junction resolvase RuvX [Abyssisolibacter fermentans]